MVVMLDLAACIVSVVMLGNVLVRYKKIDTQLLLLEAAVAVNCFGRYLLSVSQTLEVAVLANKILYFGGCYAPLLLVLLLFRLSNIQFPKAAAAAMALYSTVVMCSVLTIGSSDVYYKSVELVIGDGYSYLVKEYGPLHALYPFMMAFYGVFLVAFLVCAVRMRKKLSTRMVLSAGILGVCIIAVYALERILPTYAGAVSVAYLIAMLFIIKFFDRLNMYDMTANIINSVEQRGEFGYVVFDNKHRYISSDRYIREIFPEINDWVVDRVVAVNDSPLYTEIVQFLADGQQSNEKRSISSGDRYFELDIRPISHGKKQIGYIVELVDRTIEYKYYRSIEDYNTRLEKEVAAKTANIIHIKDMMVLGMADMVESRDNNTGGHIKRTSAVVRVFSGRLMQCGECGLSAEFLRDVAKAAPMHDLGKIAINDSILRKPGSFTDEEYAEMQRHTTEGARIVESILRGVEDDDFVKIARNVALYHHEKWNGKGYPEGLAGEDIPVEARIMALADVFDTLVSKRCYKEAMSCDEALTIIEESLGEHFDPILGREFLKCRSELERIYSTDA